MPHGVPTDRVCLGEIPGVKCACDHLKTGASSISVVSGERK